MNEYSNKDKWNDEELLNYFGSLFANKEYYTERTDKVKAELLDRMKRAGEQVTILGEFDMGKFYNDSDRYIRYNGAKPHSTSEALELSIKKYEVISYLLRSKKYPYILSGGSSCGLCMIFSDSNCDGCPIKETTGNRSCAGTPYKYFIATPEEAEEELAFLKSLRPVVARKEFGCTAKDEWAERENARRDAQLEAVQESEVRASHKANSGTDVV